ncbi:TetR/AcrR family transcriptional regulator [Zhihengliuella halotolerans]|uniref:TetR family transcriptional regulator n=1 Tax=Zhihengliuella halotolerans TaxID=370736 RepID=A0A4Q8AGB1_9MICC|nr:TetR/AcrR family transcriptional regulator [Zhihengliuella halotolerans]RZU63402.1 TetR family transcriptional regulator [Zhihengliuella halotolerans]
MTGTRNTDTRERLLEAAADLIAAHPGQDVPLRAICERVGVKMPTLYHFFGNKEGLLGAVVEHGFDLYMALKTQAEPDPDPLRNLRSGWDLHVSFGLENPAFYALMYGQVAPGSRSTAEDRPTRALLGLMEQAHAQGRLRVDPQQATDHVLAANIGVTLRQIITRTPDPALSAAMREATIEAITGLSAPAANVGPAEQASALLAALPLASEGFSAPEADLLRHWLGRIASRRTPSPPSGAST